MPESTWCIFSKTISWVTLRCIYSGGNFYCGIYRCSPGGNSPAKPITRFLSAKQACHALLIRPKPTGIFQRRALFEFLSGISAAAEDWVIIPPPYGRGHQAIQRSVRLSVPWRSCLGHRHAGCLQFSYRRPPEMCGLRTRPRTDVDPPRFLQPSNCHRRREYNGAIPCLIFFRRRNTYDIRYDTKWDIDVRSKADYSSQLILAHGTDKVHS